MKQVPSLSIHCDTTANLRPIRMSAPMPRLQFRFCTVHLLGVSAFERLSDFITAVHSRQSAAYMVDMLAHEARALLEGAMLA